MADKGRATAGALLLTLAALLWAGNFLVGRIAGATVPPFELNFLRWGVAALATAPVILVKRREIGAALRTHGAELAALPILGVVLFNTLLYAGLRGASPALAGAVFAVTPALILLLAGLWGGGRPCARQLTGACVSFIGVCLVFVGRGSLHQPMQTALAAPALVLLAAGVWALYSVALARFRVPLAPLPALAATIWCGVILMAPFAVASFDAPPSPRWSPSLSLCVLYLGLGASLAAFLAWRIGIGILGPRRAGVFLHLVPVASVLLSALALSEAPSATSLAGLGLILGGVAATQTAA